MELSLREPPAEILRSSAATRRPSTVPILLLHLGLLPSVRSVTSHGGSPTMRERSTDTRALVVTGIDADVRLEL